MCGIGGALAYRTSAPVVDETALLCASEAMARRGPDGDGRWIGPDRRIGFTHRRLAIIDISDSGAQPMSTGDGALTVTFNGEIYNYRELRRELEAAGVAFRTHSDTEVLLELYRRDGAAMVHRLRGMFAFAIWDREARQLFMARDRFGIKPLYYADDGGTIMFASQVQALHAAGIQGGIDPAGVVGFLLWGSVPEPLTLERRIRMLPAGSTLVVREGGTPRVVRYWMIEDALRESIEGAARVPPGAEGEVVRAALLDSVRAHMVADVPVGAFLSAGLDSSTIVGLAREATGSRIRTITISFEEFRNRPLDELPIATEIAKYLGVEHQGIRFSMTEVEQDLPNFFAAMDQPTIDGINTWLVSKAATQAGLKVALSGLGGDELLGGYRTFSRLPELTRRVRARAWPNWAACGYRQAYALLSRHVMALDPAQAGLYELGGSAAGAYQMCRGVFMPWELREVVDRGFAMEGLRGLGGLTDADSSQAKLPAFAEVSALESSRYMRNQLLRDTDWTSMAHSLEIRVPLVDHELTASVAGLAATGRLGIPKNVLPAALRRALPGPIVNKPKTGFTVPIWRWLRQSPHLDGWKHNEALRRKNAHDYKRLAYAILWHNDAVRQHLN